MSINGLCNNCEKEIKDNKLNLKKYCERCRESVIKNTSKKWVVDNKEKRKEWHKNYYQMNKNEIETKRRDRNRRNKNV